MYLSIYLSISTVVQHRLALNSLRSADWPPTDSLLPQSSEYWDYRHVLPCPAKMYPFISTYLII